jgi:hypothetical protein
MDLKSVSPLEIFLFVLFLVYLVFPVPTPKMLSPWIDSSIGMVIIFMVTLYLFFYTNPILGILSVFVAYELLRRSSLIMARTSIVMNTPSQERKDVQLQDMNPPPIFFPTLEEEVVSQMAPLGVSDPSVYQASSFKPVSDKLSGGSVV